MPALQNAHGNIDAERRLPRDNAALGMVRGELIHSAARHGTVDRMERRLQAEIETLRHRIASGVDFLRGVILSGVCRVGFVKNRNEKKSEEKREKKSKQDKERRTAYRKSDATLADKIKNNNRRIEKMILYIKNKLVTLRGSSTVKDESGEEAYKVKGRLVSVDCRKDITSLSGEVLFVVKNKVMDFFSTSSTFLCDASGNKLLTIAGYKDFAGSLQIRDCDKDLRIEGDFRGWDYRIYQDNAKIAFVHKNFNILRDSYALEIVDEAQDPAFLVGLCVAIDNVRDKMKKLRDSRSTTTTVSVGNDSYTYRG